MLTITRSAAEAIDTIVSSVSEVPDTGGLRIAQGVGPDGEAALALSLVEAPEATDQVVETEGARVFVESETASLLDDKILDARVEDGQVGFMLGEAGPPPTD